MWPKYLAHMGKSVYIAHWALMAMPIMDPYGSHKDKPIWTGLTQGRGMTESVRYQSVYIMHPRQFTMCNHYYNEQV